MRFQTIQKLLNYIPLLSMYYEQIIIRHASHLGEI